MFTVVQRVTDLGAAVEFFAGKYSASGTLRESRQFVNSTDFLTSGASTDGTAGTLVSAALTTNATLVGQLTLVESDYNGTNLSIRKNSSTTVSAALASVRNDTSPYFLFSRDTNAEPFAGYIAENLFWNRSLTNDERLQVGAYLRNKWGVS